MAKKPIIKISNTYSTISGVPYIILEYKYDDKGRKTPYTVLDYISDKISYEVPNLRFVLEAKPYWDGIIRLFKISKAKKNKKYDAKFLTGLVDEVIIALHEKTKIVPKVIDLRKKPCKNFDYKWNDDFKLRDYQKKVVEESVKKGNGILSLSTGAGKTIIVSKIIQELGVSPFIFFVLTKDLMYQAKKRLEASIVGLECGIIGDGECDIREVNIMTVQTAYLSYGGKNFTKEFKNIDGWSEGEVKNIRQEKLDHLEKKEDIKNLIEKAKGIYADEAHHMAAKTCEDVITKCKNAYYVFGGTATPEREDNADLLLKGLFGNKRGNITASFLIKKGFLIKPDIYFIKLKNKPKRVLTYDEDYKENLVFNEERNQIIVDIANRMRKLKLPTLILIQRLDDHGLKLEERIPESVFISGRSSKKKREQTLEDFEKGKIPVLISSTIADEGLDLPILECLIMAGGGKSKNRTKQRVGRVIRTYKNKKDKKALVFDFEDQGSYVSKHYRIRKKVLKEEEEFNVSSVQSIIDIPEIFMEGLF